MSVLQRSGHPGCYQKALDRCYQKSLDLVTLACQAQRRKLGGPYVIHPNHQAKVGCMSIPQRPGNSDCYQKALDLATLAHRGQRRKFGGGPYVIHPIRVASLCATLDPDLPHEVIAGALLHDVVEDTHLTFSELDAEFSSWVVKVVQDMTRDPAESKDAYLSRVLLTPLCRWSPIVKLCDRIDNLTDRWERAPLKWKSRYLENSQVLLGIAALNDNTMGGYSLRDHPAWWTLKGLIDLRKGDVFA